MKARSVSKVSSVSILWYLSSSPLAWLLTDIRGIVSSSYTVIQLQIIEQRGEKDLILDPGAQRQQQVKEAGPACGASGGDGGGGGQDDGVRGGEEADDTQTVADPHQQEDHWERWRG